MDKLKPCPFCGGEEVSANCTWVRCPTCGAYGPAGKDAGEGIRKWNQRIEPQNGGRNAEMNETKFCPLKRGFIANIADLRSIGVTMDEIAEKGIDDRLSQLVSGVCNKEACTWWSAERSCCGLVAGR